MTTTNDPARHIPTQAETLFHEFLASNLPIGQLREQVVLLLSSEDLRRVLREITPEVQESFIDKVNHVYLTVNAEDKHFLILFGDFCSDTKRLPASALLSAGLVKCGEVPVATGGVMDVWRGKYQSTRVAIKAFRAYPIQSLEEAKEVLRKLVPMWKKFTHPNVVAFRGVTMENFRLALVYDWGENGNIMRYVKSHPMPPRLILLLQVARGLQYLHSLDIPHGNLKGPNVLVDESGHVRLTDYGLALLNANPDLTQASPTVGNSRWLAPEIIDPPSDIVFESKPADIFAFGMLAIEVFTGEPPFQGCSSSRAARLILKGDRPELPQNAEGVGLTVQVWELLQKCWHPDPARRPTIDEVVRSCEYLTGNNECVQRTLNDQDHGAFLT
ncbi:kinase-like protein [Thelephora ganbajun]|uniref:Kinase-like protein n=1 Tax=Thelephora ganbajun TaxID=370292 RepID=A0ACB6ZDY1_THEGA|nr:kinase-like protein [Thelephora ganbajun]